MQGELFTCTLVLVYAPFAVFFFFFFLLFCFCFYFFFFPKSWLTSIFKKNFVCRPYLSSHITCFGTPVEPMSACLLFKNCLFSCFVEKAPKVLLCVPFLHTILDWWSPISAPLSGTQIRWRHVYNYKQQSSSKDSG